MGYNHASAYLVIALIFFATANPLAHAQLPGIPQQTVNVVGLICCTPTGTCTAGSPPLAGVPVVVNCTNLRTGTVATIGQTITNVNGSFSVNVSVPSLINNLGGCTARVSLPLLNQTACDVLANTTGAIRGIIGPIVPLIGQFIAIVFGLARVSV